MIEDRDPATGLLLGYWIAPAEAERLVREHAAERKAAAAAEPPKFHRLAEARGSVFTLAASKIRRWNSL